MALPMASGKTFKTKGEAVSYVGGLSAPGKMPCPGYSLPASRCKVGSKLRKVAGSTCASCYACKGRYGFPNVQSALERRYKAIMTDHWVSAMVRAIGKQRYFRWHDSGDLDSVEHLRRICAIAEQTPDCRHWLPTREYQTVKRYIAEYGPIPSNLAVRLSAHMIDGTAPAVSDGEHRLPVSFVHGKGSKARGTACPAPTQGNKCGDCRACWDRSVDVSYHIH